MWYLLCDNFNDSSSRKAHLVTMKFSSPSFSKNPIYLKITQKPAIDQFTTPDYVVHNGGSPNFQELLFDKKTTCMAQILHNLSYKVCSITLPKFNTFGLFIMILGTSAIMDQTACCYNVTTSETGLQYNV